MTENQRLEIEGRAFQLMTGRTPPWKFADVLKCSAEINEAEVCWLEWHEFHRRIIRAMETAFEEVTTL